MSEVDIEVNGEFFTLDVPAGTSDDQISQFVSANMDQFAPTLSPSSRELGRDDQARLREAKEAQQRAAGIPEDLIGGATSATNQANFMEKLRVENPVLADEIENTSIGQQMLIGAGKQAATMGRGVGLLPEESEEDKRVFDALKRGTGGAVGTGELIGAAAPLAVPGAAVARIPSALGRVAAGGSLAALEGGIQASGEGRDVLTGVALGAAIGGPLSKFTTTAGARLAKQNRQLMSPETGLPTPEFQKALDKRGMDFGALIGDGKNLPVVFGNQSPGQVVDNIIKKKLKSGDQTNALFNLKLDAKGNVIKNKFGDEALKQGFKKGQIAAVNSANKSTKREMRKMLSMKRSIHADDSKALEFRPTNIVGDSAMDRFNFIRRKASDLRKELDTVASKEFGPGKNLLESDKAGGLLRGRQIDPAKVSGTYFTGLEKLGVQVDDSVFPPKLNFTASAISEDKTSQRVIKSVTRILAKGGGGDIDALTAHGFKKQLDTMLDFNKKAASGLTDSGKKFTGDIRRSLNESIRDVSPRYARVNDELSKSLTSMESFDKALGGIDAFADNASVSVGQTLRRLLSNAQSKANLDTALTSLDDVAKELGGEFDVDVRRLIQFNNTLDDRFTATAKGSMQGTLESAARSGPREAAKDFAFKKGAGKIDDIRGISDSNAFNVMEKILKGLDK